MQPKTSSRNRSTPLPHEWRCLNIGFRSTPPARLLKEAPVSGPISTISANESDHDAVLNSFKDTSDDAMPAGGEARDFTDQKKGSANNAAKGEEYRDQIFSQHQAPESSYADTGPAHTPQATGKDESIPGLTQRKKSSKDSKFCEQSERWEQVQHV